MHEFRGIDEDNFDQQALSAVRLSWNAVRTLAAAFAEDWKGAAYKKDETQNCTPTRQLTRNRPTVFLDV